MLTNDYKSQAPSSFIKPVSHMAESQDLQSVEERPQLQLHSPIAMLVEMEEPEQQPLEHLHAAPVPQHPEDSILTLALPQQPGFGSISVSRNDLDEQQPCGSVLTFTPDPPQQEAPEAGRGVFSKSRILESADESTDEFAVRFNPESCDSDPSLFLPFLFMVTFGKVEQMHGFPKWH